MNRMTGTSHSDTDQQSEERLRDVLLQQVKELRRTLQQREAANQQLERYVADLHTLIQQRDQAVAQAERASRVREDLLANVSHDFREPLNAIIGFAQVLQADPALHHQADAVQRVINAGLRLERLVDGVIGELRTDQRAIENQSRVHLGELLDLLWSQLSPSLRDRCFRQATLCEGSSMQEPLVRGEATRLVVALRHVLEALLTEHASITLTPVHWPGRDLQLLIHATPEALHVDPSTDALTTQPHALDRAQLLLESIGGRLERGGPGHHCLAQVGLRT